MAFAIRNLSVLAYASGFTLWLYKSGIDAQDDIMCGSFFRDAGDMLAGGDMMMVSMHNGGRMLSVLADSGGIQTVPLI